MGTDHPTSPWHGSEDATSLPRCSPNLVLSVELNLSHLNGRKPFSAYRALRYFDDNTYSILLHLLADKLKFGRCLVNSLANVITFLTHHGFSPQERNKQIEQWNDQLLMAEWETKENCWKIKREVGENWDWRSREEKSYGKERLSKTKKRQIQRGQSSLCFLKLPLTMWKYFPEWIQIIRKDFEEFVQILRRAKLTTTRF